MSRYYRDDFFPAGRPFRVGLDGLAGIGHAVKQWWLMEHDVDVNLLPEVRGTGSSLLMGVVRDGRFDFRGGQARTTGPVTGVSFQAPRPVAPVIGASHAGCGPFWSKSSRVPHRRRGHDVNDRRAELPSLTIYIPRALLDDLAGGLSREHRQWVELTAS